MMWEPPRTGLVLGARWRLEAPLARGAHGAVWRGADVDQGGAVAVKLLHASCASPAGLARFALEAELQARVVHPVVVPALDARTTPPPYITMPLVEGESLHDRCVDRSQRSAPLSFSAVLWLLERLCAGVAAAHAAGVVHGDVKPRNVLVNRRGDAPFVRVLDFGAARPVGAAPGSGRLVLGSALYLAPEVAAEEEVGPAADEFALASIAFELLTLRRAWARDDDDAPLPFGAPVGASGDNHQLAVLRRILQGPRPSLLEHRPDAGPLADAVLRRALAPRPEARHGDVLAFERALRAALPDDPRPGEVGGASAAGG